MYLQETGNRENSKWDVICMEKRNLIFWIVLVFAILFVFSHLFLRISFVEHFLLWFLKPLKDSDYKSSYIETVGAIIGTILAITGTLLLQGMIDKKERIEKEEQKQKEFQYKVVIVYYDLKLAFSDIAKIYNLLVISAFLVDEKNKVDEFYDSASKIEIYIDENWIRNVASLYEEFDGLLNEDGTLVKSADPINDDNINESYRLSNTTDKYTGKAPTYLGGNHDLSYGEIDSPDKKNDDTDNENKSLEYFSRPSANKDENDHYDDVSDELLSIIFTSLIEDD